MLLAVAAVSTSTGLGGFIVVVAALVAVVGALAVAYTVFRSKSMQESNKLLRDLNDDLSHAYKYEKGLRADLEARNQKLDGALDEFLKRTHHDD